MQITETTYAGYECLKLDNGALTLWVTTAVGPRIIGAALPGGENLLAVIPEVTIPTGDGRVFQLRGGHRLWHAPEDSTRTYVPDDDPLTVTQIENGVCLSQSVEPSTGIAKMMCVSLEAQGARATVEHRLTNQGLWPVSLAPWAITQLKPGGLGILPQLQEDTGLLPNRRLALWPYTQVNSPHIHWGDRYIFIDATLPEGALKIGWANPAGWLAYAVDGSLFVKQTAYQPEAEYFDFGSSSECYCGPDFIELETLGPRVTLQPGQTVTHVEQWALYGDVRVPAEETAVAAALAKLGL
jgi:hypothetical protein